jgi:Rps23 Pro-64 3,4-dihydroxylase Tpa1-like proline 4-hydroxylase
MEINSNLESQKTDDVLLQRSKEYQTNKPFPHIVIDHFFSNEILKQIEAEFPAIDSPKWNRYVHHFSVKLALSKLELMGPETQKLIEYLNGKPFMKYLTQLTGIEDLQSDPFFEGGGLHQITRGGFLGVHADFNFHKKLGLHRRLNLLIYLNDNWADEFGGALELWDEKVTEVQKKIFPIFNRMVVFNTTDFSFHGHPEPLNCPADRSRKSIALYYYTQTRPAHEISAAHSTLYRARPSDSQELKEIAKKAQKPPSLKSKIKSFIKKIVLK